jgi:hypothetical protein
MNGLDFSNGFDLQDNAALYQKIEPELITNLLLLIIQRHWNLLFHKEIPGLKFT